MQDGISATELRQRLTGQREIALLDVREAGQFGLGHILLAVPAPYSVLELRVRTLVPRRTAPVVLVDAGNGVAQRARRRLLDLGYTDVRCLEGGMAGWAAAGGELFHGVNVPGKAFGELVELACDPPTLTAEALASMLDGARPPVILDGRTPSEHRVMCIPGAISVPNGELALRVADVAPDPEVPIVVHCAGRTRSIIGAQTLINAGVPNPVHVLRGGTMGWRLAGLPLERGSTRSYPPLSQEGAARAAAYAESFVARYGVPTVDAATINAWAAESDRTLYLLDVRSAAEFAAGHWPGAVHAPGGQLVHGTDQWCATRGARIALLDTAPYTRAIQTAHWLRQLGWDAVAVTDAAWPSSRPLVSDAPGDTLPGAEIPTITPAALHGAPETLIIDASNSQAYRAAHLPGAVWAIRPRMVDALRRVPRSTALAVYAEDDGRARLAAAEMHEAGYERVAVLAGGLSGWVAAGRPTEGSPDCPADADCIDHLFWVADRHQGNDEAAREYMAWEQALPAQVAADGLMQVRLTGHQA